MEDRSINILLVEDDEVDVINIKRIFKKYRINNPLYIAKNGVQALEMLHSQEGRSPVVPEKRRLILLDLNMPKMNGIEFLHEIRKNEKLKRTPVIVLTTSNADQDRIEAYNLNVAGYLLKSVNFSSFTDAIVAINQYWTLCEMP